MRTTLRMLVLAALVTMGAWAFTGPVHAQTPTDTAETPTDTAETDDEDNGDEDGGDEDKDEADEDAAAATAQRGGDDDDDLPNTGAPIWLFAAAGAGLLHIGGGMLLAERRQRRPDTYWEDHRA